jgi:hypothetical protein
MLDHRGQSELAVLALVLSDGRGIGRHAPRGRPRMRSCQAQTTCRCAVVGPIGNMPVGRWPGSVQAPWPEIDRLPTVRTRRARSFAQGHATVGNSRKGVLDRTGERRECLQEFFFSARKSHRAQIALLGVDYCGASAASPIASDTDSPLRVAHGLKKVLWTIAVPLLLPRDHSAWHARIRVSHTVRSSLLARYLRSRNAQYATSPKVPRQSRS